MMKRIALCIPIFFLLLSSPGYAQNTADPEGEFKAATNSLVLLKNHGHILPLDTNQINSIAIIGPTIYQPGIASGYPKKKLLDYTSPYEGLLNHAGHDIYLQKALGVNIKYDVQALDTSMVYIGQGVNGFSAKYYNNLKASGSPAKFATDKYIDFNWGTNIPYPELDSTAFSAKWDATLIPTHGPVKVKLIHTDGCRLYLDGKIIIDAWESGPLRMDSAWLNIQKGMSYNLQIDYFSNGGPAIIKLGFDYLLDIMITNAVEKAKLADMAIVFIGQPLIQDSMKQSCKIPNQSRLVRAVYDANPNTIVVLQTMVAVDIEEWAFDVPAIIQAWDAEENSGNEMGEVLFGKMDPVGKLPFRWSMNEDQNFDTRFPYGHGLTYTIFGIGKLLMKRNRDNSGWTATVEIRNVGERAGTESLQLYVRYAERERTIKELKAFKEVTLFPQQKKTVAIPLPYSAFEKMNDDGDLTIDPGMYEIYIGTSAEDIKLMKTIELKQIHINQYLQNE